MFRQSEKSLAIKFNQDFYKQYKHAVELRFFSGHEKDETDQHTLRIIFSTSDFLNKVGEALVKTTEDRPWNEISDILQEIAVKKKEPNKDFRKHVENFENLRERAIKTNMYRDIQAQPVFLFGRHRHEINAIEAKWKKRMTVLKDGGYDLFKLVLFSSDFQQWTKKSFLSDDILDYYDKTEQTAYEAKELSVIFKQINDRRYRKKFLFHAITINAKHENHFSVDESGKCVEGKDDLIDFYATLKNDDREDFKESMLSFAAHHPDKVEWAKKIVRQGREQVKENKDLFSLTIVKMVDAVKDICGLHAERKLNGALFKNECRKAEQERMRKLLREQQNKLDA